MYIEEGDKIKLSWTRTELFGELCDVSSLNAKLITADNNSANRLIISDDEKFYFDHNIGNVISLLSSYFVRLFPDEQNFVDDGTEVGFTFKARKKVVNQFAAGELDILHDVCHRYIHVSLLKLWYTTIGLNENLAKQYIDELVAIDLRLRDALFQFFKPVNNGRSHAITRVSIGDGRNLNYEDKFETDLSIRYESGIGYVTEGIKVTRNTLHFIVKADTAGPLLIEMSESGMEWEVVQQDELPLGGTDVYLVNMKPVKYVRLRAAYIFTATLIMMDNLDARQALSVVGVRWIQRIGDDIMVCHTDGQIYSAGKVYNGNTTIRLYQRKETMPEVPQSSLSYSLETSSFISDSELLEGWTLSVPANITIQCWMIEQTVAAYGHSESVTLLAENWSTPIKVF